MTIKQINDTVAVYSRWSIWLIAGMALMTLLVMQVFALPLLVPVIVSVAFNLIAGMAYGAAWKALARNSPENLAKFYLAGSAFRIMSGLLVVLVFCVLNKGNRSGILQFSIVFMTFYIVMLLFDTVYFAKVERTKK